MKTFTKQLLVAARRSILLALSAALAASAAVAEPAGIRYSDFIKYGEPTHAPLTGGKDFNVATFSPALTAAESTPRGVYLGFVGLLAVVIVLASTSKKRGESGQPGEPGLPGEQGLSGGERGERGERGEQGEQGEQGRAGDEGGRGFPGLRGEQGRQGDQGDSAPDDDPTMLDCADGGIRDIKPTFSRAASRPYVDGDNLLMEGVDLTGNFDTAITSGDLGGLLSQLAALRNPDDTMSFYQRSSFTGSFRLVRDDQSRVGDAEAGDAVRAVDNTLDSPGQPAGEGGLLGGGAGEVLTSAREYRIYSDGVDVNANGAERPRLFFAEGASYNNDLDYEAGRGMVDGVLQCNVAGSERFFLDSNFALTRNFAEGVTRAQLPFALRTTWRGLMSGPAVRIGNFMVSQNSDLRNTHIEHQATAFAAGAFAVHTDSGWRRFDSGNSTMTYAKNTATWDLTPAVQLYAQNTGGWLNSSKYANGRLQAQAFGVFADKVLRHDDSYHLRLESPLADSRAQIWRLAADTSIGTAADYLRLGLHHQINGNKTGMRLFYSREF